MGMQGHAFFFEEIALASRRRFLRFLGGQVQTFMIGTERTQRRSRRSGYQLIVGATGDKRMALTQLTTRGFASGWLVPARGLGRDHDHGVYLFREAMAAGGIW